MLDTCSTMESNGTLSLSRATKNCSEPLIEDMRTSDFILTRAI
jgi:hypothetical protein